MSRPSKMRIMHLGGKKTGKYLSFGPVGAIENREEERGPRRKTNLGMSRTIKDD